MFKHHFSLFFKVDFFCVGAQYSWGGDGRRHALSLIFLGGGGFVWLLHFNDLSCWPYHATTATKNSGLSYCFGTFNFQLNNVVKTFAALFFLPNCVNICGKCR